MSDPVKFDSAFEKLTGHPPFPWQYELHKLFMMGTESIPQSCNLPTGLGKTSVIAVWLIALANGAKVPRRLVYVVNRRTVVDQTTEEVEKYRDNYEAAGVPRIAISTLRGQHADNREWSEDPSRPAVICGTVDMIGSRLLFSGYGIGMKARPLHAGFLGQDALLVHDEAHLEPAFQKLIEAIEQEQKRCKEFGTFRVMELTATSRNNGEKPFSLNDVDYLNETVVARVTSAKKLHLHPLADAKKPQTELAAKALQLRDSGKAVLVFAYSVESVIAIQEALDNAKLPVKTLTGTMRGKERDGLVDDKTFGRFLPTPPSDRTPGTVYLICTSAGEVGVNISADHLLCDLSTFESMAQRFGRVNRFGKFDECEVHVYFPQEWDDKHPLTGPRQRTLELLRPLEGQSVSPKVLGEIPAEQRQAAFAPPPTILPATDILFDAWALTSITEKLPGRPKVEPYLHGIGGWEPPETYVAWREEVGVLTEELRQLYRPVDVLEKYPLLPHELLKEPSHRAFRRFEEMAKRRPADLAWVIDEEGTVEVMTIEELADKDSKERIEQKTVLFAPSSGGLKSGMLDGTSDAADDVSTTKDRQRTWDDADEPQGMACFHTLDTQPDADEETTNKRMWYFWSIPNEGGSACPLPVEWGVHVNDVVKAADRILKNLPLDDALKQAIHLAAKYHDHGKDRKLFQTVLGNSRYPAIVLAKSGTKSKTKLQETYRHEFGSLLDLTKKFHAELSQHAPELQELVLHLIATHHGRGRPHFPLDEVFDPNHPQKVSDTMAASVPQRFARLQRKYGRWGLAYLESLLRATDWAASASPTSYFEEGQS